MPTKPPTLMQERAVKDTLANLGRRRPKTKKAILKGAGYSPAIQKNPDIVIESKGFQELLKEYLPEDLVAKRHLDLLNKRDVRIVGKGKKIDVGLDVNAVKAGVDMAYKIRGSYAPERSVNINVNANLRKNPKLIKATKQYEEDIKKRLLEPE